MNVGANIEILPVRDVDHDAWLRLWRGYQAFYKADIAAEVSATTWSRLLDPAEPMTALLAWSGGQALGLVQFIRHRSTWTQDDYCYLQDLFVDPDARGGGLGRRLIEALYARAAEWRCPRVYWLTHETNREAMQLYDRIAERSGFVQYRKQAPR